MKAGLIKEKWKNAYFEFESWFVFSFSEADGFDFNFKKCVQMIRVWAISRTSLMLETGNCTLVVIPNKLKNEPIAKNNSEPPWTSVSTISSESSDNMFSYLFF